MGVLEKAMQLADQDPDAEDDDDEEEGRREAPRVGGRIKSAGVALMQPRTLNGLPPSQARRMFHSLPQQLSGWTVG